MSTPDLDTLTGPPPPPPAAAPNGGAPEQDHDDPLASALEGLRAERRKVFSDTSKVFVIPGYEEKSTPLACRYGIIPLAELKAIQQRAVEAEATGGELAEFDMWCDELVASAQEVGLMVDGEFQSLPGAPRYDHNLARALDLDLSEKSQRAVLRGVFGAEWGPERGPYQIIAHHTEVVTEWMHGRGEGGAARKADEEFAKNS